MDYRGTRPAGGPGDPGARGACGRRLGGPRGRGGRGGLGQGGSGGSAREEAGGSAREEAGGSAEFWHRGRFDLRYVFRATGGSPDESDQDLFEDLFVEGGYGDGVRFEGSGRLHEDLDGHARLSLFRDLYDTHDDAVQGWLYTGFVEFLDQGPIARLRIGRQYYAEGVDVRFDGGLVETEALHFSRDLALSGRLRYVAQLGAYRDLSLQFSPLDDVIGEYEPYHEGYADLRKTFGEHFTLGGGFAVRQLQNERDEGPFNHEFLRLFGLAELADLPWKDLVVSFLVESYRSDVADRLYDLSADLSQKIGPVTFGGGTSYALYRFDEFFLVERDQVRTCYGSLEVRPFKWLRPRVTYSFEEDDEDEFHVLRFDLRISF